MKNRTPLVVALATCLSVAAMSASAADTGFYVGGGIGNANYSDDIGDQIRSAYHGSTAFTVTSADLTDDSDRAFKVTGGFRFLPWLGVELAWTDAGEAQSDYVLHSLVPLTNADAIVQGTYDLSGFSASVVGEIPFGEMFYGAGRLGLVAANIDYSEVGVDAAGAAHRFSHDNSDTLTQAGLSLGWRINPSWDQRFDWDRWFDAGKRFGLADDSNGRFDDIDMYTLNLHYRIGE